ncbi:dTMP kinase [Propionicicella superfundia]|uniref:dTMP kinase n=1 Tax=Propionicicella superfundia TaxID=348582 RepID=UPI00042375FA|nr:dTMP kinase [Propionicicella superfundia]
MTGVFVVFEGGDHSGKSTHTALLAASVRAAGYEVVQTREPGGTAAGERIRDILLDPATGDLDARAEALLYAADKAHHLTAVVMPALARGAVVVCDRYVDSMIAYQGAGRVLDVEDVERVARWATRDVRPDLTVLLDVDPRRAVHRIADKDRLEGEGVEFHERVRQGFLALAAGDPERYLVTPGMEELDATAALVHDRVMRILSRRAATLDT